MGEAESLGTSKVGLTVLARLMICQLCGGKTQKRDNGFCLP